MAARFAKGGSKDMAVTVRGEWRDGEWQRMRGFKAALGVLAE